MDRYTVKHRYFARRDGQTFGPWDADIEVELSTEDAAWINRDSPGTLAPVQAKAAPAPTTQRAQTPTANRQHRGGRGRA